MSLTLGACNSDTPEETDKETEKKEDENNEDEVKLNIIDDNYRNWYEIFVYSFYDTDNDGIGDLNGVTAKLDYILPFSRIADCEGIDENNVMTINKTVDSFYFISRCIAITFPNIISGDIMFTFKLGYLGFIACNMIPFEYLYNFIIPFLNTIMPCCFIFVNVVK